MKKSLWKNITRINKMNYDLNGKSVMKLVEEVLGSSYLKSDSAWYSDQKIISILIKKHAGLFEIEKKRYEGKRLDRSLNESDWKRLLKYEFDKITDAHTFKSNIFEKWHLLNDLFYKIFNSELNRFLNNYFFEFINI